MREGAARDFDIEAFIDRQRIGGVHIAILILSTALLFLDGFDIFLVGKIAPAIAASFGEPAANMSIVFLFQQTGLALGAFLIGPAADRYGRKKVLVISVAAFGVLTLAIVFAQSLVQLATLRGLSGLFLGGILPIVMTLVSELIPKRRRGVFLSVTMAGYTAGGASGAAVAAWLLDDHGWQSGFWIGGLVPLAVAPLFLILVPESLLFLVRRDASDPRLARAVARLSPGALEGGERFTGGAPRNKSERASLFEVFEEGRGLPSAFFWIACFLSMGNIALLASWLPTFFQEMGGIPIQKFAIVSMISFIGGLAGTLSIGWLLDRFKQDRILICFFGANAACIASLAFLPFGTVPFVLVLILWSFCQSGGQAGLNTFITAYYPPKVRGTGFAWAGGCGRVGGIIGPQIGGLALLFSLSLQETLLLIAIPPLTVAAIALVAGRFQVGAKVAVTEGGA